MIDTELANNTLESLLIDSEVGLISGLHYKNRDSQEETSSPLTLLLHGSGGGARSLAKLAQLLNVPGPLLIPDLNGYGQTRLNPAIAAEHDALAQHRLIIDTLLQSHCQPGQPVIIIGHSMGGLLSLLTTLDKQWPVIKVIVIEPVAFSVLELTEDKAAQTEDLEKVLALDAALKGSGDPEQALAQFIAYWNGVKWQDLPEPMQEALLNQVEQIGADTIAVARDSTATTRYRTMNLPVMLLQGTLTPAPAKVVIQRLGQLLPDVKTRIVEGAGHMGPVQRPSLYAPLINDFLL